MSGSSDAACQSPGGTTSSLLSLDNSHHGHASGCAVWERLCVWPLEEPEGQGVAASLQPMCKLSRKLRWLGRVVLRRRGGQWHQAPAGDLHPRRNPPIKNSASLSFPSSDRGAEAQTSLQDLQLCCNSSGLRALTQLAQDVMGKPAAVDTEISCARVSQYERVVCCGSCCTAAGHPSLLGPRQKQIAIAAEANPVPPSQHLVPEQGCHSRVAKWLLAAARLLALQAGKAQLFWRNPHAAQPPHLAC